jgi:hypothetical protein
MSSSCPHLDHGSCRVASTLYAAAAATEQACGACLHEEPPQAVNAVTVSLALSAAMAAEDSAAVAAILRAYGPLLRLRDPANAQRLEAILAGHGVGSHMWRILAGWGVDHDDGCECLAWAERLNAWGPAGCRMARKEIVAHLRASAKTYGWTASVKAASVAVGRAAVDMLTTGKAWLPNPLDVYGSLLDESIRLAEADCDVHLSTAQT